MQIFLSIAFLYIASSILDSYPDDQPGGNLWWILLLLAPLVIMTRYEGMFLVFAICLLFFAKRRFLYAMDWGRSAFSRLLFMV
jgi:hypothetical protein